MYNKYEKTEMANAKKAKIIEDKIIECDEGPSFMLHCSSAIFKTLMKDDDPACSDIMLRIFKKMVMDESISVEDIDTMNNHILKYDADKDNKETEHILLDAIKLANTSDL